MTALRFENYMKTVKGWTLPKACVRHEAQAIADAPHILYDLSVIS